MGVATITVTSENSFSGTVGLGVSGLPSGVTAAFSPASTTGKSTLTFKAGSTATAGTATVTVTGVSGELTSATTIVLTITVPTFTLSLQPANLGFPRGASAAGMVTVISQNGFSSGVTFSVLGLPSGVTVAFTAPVATNTSVMIFAASSKATAGSFPITVKGVSGALTSSASFTLTVLVPLSGTSPVNLATAYNITAMVMDGLPFAGAGLDGGLNGSSTAFSANLIGAQQTIGGALFYFGPANTPDAVSAKTVSLAPGRFSSITIWPQE